MDEYQDYVRGEARSFLSDEAASYSNNDRIHVRCTSKQNPTATMGAGQSQEHQSSKCASDCTLKLGIVESEVSAKLFLSAVPTAL